MADRFPLILNTSANQIQEIASGDQLDLSGNNIANAGIITAGNVTVGAATTDLIVNGDARVTGILTVGTGSLTLDGPNNLVNVGTALTLGHTQGLQFHTQNLHSAGFEINQINASGIITATEADINGDLDVDGHTNLDNVSIAGVVTATSFVGGLPITNGADNRVITATGADALNAESGFTFDGTDVQVPDKILLNTSGSSIKSNQLRFQSGGAAYIDQYNTSQSINIRVSSSSALDTTAMTINHNGNVAIAKDLDVDGHTNLDNVSISGFTTTGTLNVTSDYPTINLTDTNNNDFRIQNRNGVLSFVDVANSDVVKFAIDSSNGINSMAGTLAVGHLDSNAGIDVTGNLIASGNVTAVDGTFSGNISIGGTLTYEDVTNIDAVGIVTARLGVFIPDGQKLQLGNAAGSADLQIHHTTNNSFIKNTTGQLQIQADNLGVTNASASAYNLYTYPNGAINLYYAGNKKFETTNTGATVSGTLNATTFVGALTGTASGNATITSNGDNRIITGGSGNALTGESELTYSTYLNLTRSNSDTNFGDNSAPGGVNGIFIGNSQSTNGVFSAITLAPNDTNGTNQAGSLIAKSVNGGHSPEVHITQRTGNNTTESNFKITSTRSVELRYQGNTRLQTSNEGVKIGTTMFTGSTTNVSNEAVVISPSTSSGSGYADNHIISIGQLNGNWEQGTTGADTAFGMLFHYANNASAAKQLRAGIVYDHKSSEEFQIWSSYGSIAFYTDTANSGNETPVTCNVKCAEFDANGHFVPGSNAARDLGTSSLRWRNLYTNDLNLSNESGKNDVDGTWGNYTIQEGENDLFLINNRSGKKYKFNLTEVS